MSLIHGNLYLLQLKRSLKRWNSNFYHMSQIFHGVPLHFSNYWESLAAKGRRRFYETMDWQKAWSIRDTCACNIQRASRENRDSYRTGSSQLRCRCMQLWLRTSEGCGALWRWKSFTNCIFLLLLNDYQDKRYPFE